MSITNLFTGHASHETYGPVHVTNFSMSDPVMHSIGSADTFPERYIGLDDTDESHADRRNHVKPPLSPASCDFYKRKFQVHRNIDADRELPRAIRDALRFIVSKCDSKGRYVGSAKTIAEGSGCCTDTVEAARRHPAFQKYVHCTPGLHRGIASEYSITEFALAGLLIREAAEKTTRGGHSRLLSVPVEKLQGGETLPPPPGEACAYLESSRRKTRRLGGTRVADDPAPAPIGTPRPASSPKGEPSPPYSQPKGEESTFFTPQKGGLGAPLKSKSKEEKEERRAAPPQGATAPLDGHDLAGRETGSGVAHRGHRPTDEQIARFLEAHPRPCNKEEAIRAFRQTVEDGEDPETLIAKARSYAREVKPRKEKGVWGAKNWLLQGIYRTQDGSAGMSAKEQAEARERFLINAARMITQRSNACGSIKPGTVIELLRRDLVTREDCRRASVSVPAYYRDTALITGGLQDAED